MGSKIKALRTAKKWSYPVLAKKTGLNMSNLWFIEQGRINLHLLTLKQIADVFEVDVKYFL
ncbi:MAG: helix-turn-helix transcriptional regulator [Bacteroidetes bacterium]|nr:helix-turn-helix transcriptional regulator [Bacteroidota bacterium]